MSDDARDAIKRLNDGDSTIVPTATMMRRRYEAFMGQQGAKDDVWRQAVQKIMDDMWQRVQQQCFAHGGLERRRGPEFMDITGPSS